MYKLLYTIGKINLIPCFTTPVLTIQSMSQVTDFRKELLSLQWLACMHTFVLQKPLFSSMNNTYIFRIYGQKAKISITYTFS